MIPEVEVAARIGKSRQTLRNWRKGYWNVDKNGKEMWYDPRLKENVHWKKVGNTVVYDEKWVTKMEAAKRETDRLFENVPDR